MIFKSSCTKILRKCIHQKKTMTFADKTSNMYRLDKQEYHHLQNAVCKLIGIFMLSLIGNKYNPNNIGLYRDDRSAVFKNTSGPQSGSQDFSKSV